MITNTNLINNVITSDYSKRKEFIEFIDSINSDVSLLIMSDKKKNSSIISSANKQDIEENSNKNFDQKLVINGISYENFFTNTQKWIGHVTEMKDDIFYAQLEDLTRPGTSETGEFEFAEVSQDDKPLLEIGSTFYWSVGYSHEDGQISKKSLIRFQRVIKWDENYLENVSDRANSLRNTLKWD